MTKLEAIKRLEWLIMVSKYMDSVTLGGDDMECLEMAVDALREKEAKDTNVLTNRDRVHAMTDEELAEWFDRLLCGSRSVEECGTFNKSCTACALDWLKQPYKETT